MKAACLLLIIGLSYTAGFLLDRKVCYGSLGCFSTEFPFRSTSRPLTLLPQDPSVVKTTFRLFTRKNPDAASEKLLDYNQPYNIPKTDFDANRKTMFIIHGFLDEGVHDPSKPYWHTLIAELLRQGDYNVIAVDWNGGNKLPYTQATANTRLVGAQLASLILQMQKAAGLKFPDVHIIGHSLGAHIAGYAGERVPNVGRISGIDPADPYFTNTDPLVRLDPTDASFVDVIHTDAASVLELGLGSPQEMGHVDFFPNGGKAQPDCAHKYNKLGASVLKLLTLDGKGVEVAFSCSHVIGIKYFIDSINSDCPFNTFSCTNWETFQQGKCLKCAGENGCARMGFHTPRTARGKQFSVTSGHAPYCKRHYAVTVKTDRKAAVSKGALVASVQGSSGTTQPQTIIEPDTRLEANTEFTKLITTSYDIGTAENLLLRFQKASSWITDWIYPDNMDFSHVKVLSGETQASYESCMRGVTKTHHDTEEKISISTARCEG